MNDSYTTEYYRYLPFITYDQQLPYTIAKLNPCIMYTSTSIEYMIEYANGGCVLGISDFEFVVRGHAALHLAGTCEALPGRPGGADTV